MLERSPFARQIVFIIVRLYPVVCAEEQRYVTMKITPISARLGRSLDARMTDGLMPC